MMLADQGADVIKAESPNGDMMREYGARHRGMSASFLSCNRGKRSLCVDFKSEGGLKFVRRLVATADVLVQNFRPGAVDRMGLGEDVVRKLSPDIIFISISGFGETGPYAHRKDYDPVIQALSGLAEIQTDRETGRPRIVRTVVPDKTTALSAAQAITSALFACERRGLIHRGEALQMMIGGPKGHVDHRQTLEIMPDRKLVGHAHAAVKLHGPLSDELSGASGVELRRAGRLRADRRRTRHRRGRAFHQRRCQFLFHKHVDGGVLQNLK